MLKLFPESIWTQILTPWCRLNFVSEITESDVRNQIIWLNSHIRIGGKPIQWGGWIQKNIIFVQDLVNSLGTRHSVEYMCTTFGVNWMDVLSLYAAIPSEWWSLIISDRSLIQNQCLHDKLLQKKKVVRELYFLLNTDDRRVLKYRDRWINQSRVYISDENYIRAFRNIYIYTTESKYRDFQYRLLLRKLPTNSDLCEWGLKPVSDCTFCEREVETITHLLYLCPFSSNIWEGLLGEWGTCTPLALTWELENVVINNIVSRIGHILNLLTVVVKQYIYRCRCENKIPTFVGAKNVIRNVRLSELFQSKLKGDRYLKKHYRRWLSVYPLYEDLIH